MTYYINPLWVYIYGIIDSLKDYLELISFIALSVFIIAGYIRVVSYDTEFVKNGFRILHKILKISIVIAISASVINIFIPDKKTCLEMIVANTVTKENADGAIEKTKELVDYIIESVNKMDNKDEEKSK